MMLTILPAAIVFFLILIIAAIVIKGKKPVTLKFTYRLLLTYFIVLCISAATAAFVMGDSTGVKKIVSEENISKNVKDLEKQLNSGRYAEIPRESLIKHSSFDYHQPSIQVRINEYFNPRIFIDKKELDDGVIDVYAYTSGLYISGADFTNQIKAPTFSIMNDQLEINPPDNQQEINVSMIKNEFTITQFIGGGTTLFEPIEHNETMILIRIPKNLTIQDEENMYFLQYINK
ncbi:hypothetical protein [Niallia oryzisoli]|uniref:hypothetical protein n=1 Tax=Niallia oryzisoli TaxID=1737571 RepID=UPI003735A62F